MHLDADMSCCIILIEGIKGEQILIQKSYIIYLVSKVGPTTHFTRTHAMLTLLKITDEGPKITTIKDLAVKYSFCL